MTFDILPEAMVKLLDAETIVALLMGTVSVAEEKLMEITERVNIERDRIVAFNKLEFELRASVTLENSLRMKLDIENTHLRSEIESLKAEIEKQKGA